MLKSDIINAKPEEEGDFFFESTSEQQQKKLMCRLYMVSGESKQNRGTCFKKKKGGEIHKEEEKCPKVSIEKGRDQNPTIQRT